MDFILSLAAAAVLTCAGNVWINKLYRKSKDLSFPKKISERAKFRLPILFVTLTISFCAANGDLWLMAAFFLLLLMTVTDFEQYMLFDAMTLPLAIIGLVRIFWLGLNFWDGAITAIVGGSIFVLLALILKGGIGGGDVKLVAALGLWLGGEGLLNVVLVGSILGGITAVFMILFKHKTRRSYFAYGPYFTLTAIYFLLTAA